ncbi:MAG: BamA/TamA family outer membrane protein [Xenococcaceae cyanobacterium MO_167.B52]|nr:BamA/TamA family outer membrane protein [Xenococcaceae cyanobacterium MO_167.B52]
MEVLEKNKNVGLYCCLKIITTSLIFTVGLSWGAKAEIISVLPKDEVIRRDSAREIPREGKTAKAGVVSKSLTPQKYDAPNSSIILPLLVKEPKSKVLRRPKGYRSAYQTTERSETGSWSGNPTELPRSASTSSAPLTLLPNPQKKPKVLPKQLNFTTTSQQVTEDSSSNGNESSTIASSSLLVADSLQPLKQNSEQVFTNPVWSRLLRHEMTERSETGSWSGSPTELPRSASTSSIIAQETTPSETENPPTETTPETEQSPELSEPTPEEPRVLVAEVAVIGVEGELEDIVYRAIDTEPGRTTTRSQLQEDINAIFATGFFQNIEVSPEDTPLGVRVAFVVTPNPILNQVTIQTLPADAKQQVFPPEKIEEIFQPSYGQILNLRELQDGIIQINQWYSDNGYELAQVVGSPEVSPNGTVTLIVAEGVIEDIQVKFFDEDNDPTDGKTRDFIVTREIQLQPGDVFKRDIAQRDLRRVFGLGIFEDVRVSFSPGEDPSKVVLNVELIESSTGSISAGAGFSSTSDLFGTVSYQQQNLGGNNQTLGAELQVGIRELLFDLNFTDPWIATDSNRTSYTVNAFRRRSISLVYDGDGDQIRTFDGFNENGQERRGDSPRVVRTGGGITFSRPLAKDPFTRADWRLSPGFQYQRVVIKDADGNTSPKSRVSDGFQNLAFSDSGKDDLFIFRFGATRDRRNNRLQPTKGSVLRLNTEQTVPVGSGSILFNRLRGSYSYYIPLSLINFSEGPQALAFNVQGGTVIGDLPPYEAFVLGGSNSVRGFREGEVGSGKSYVQATAEYRFPIFRIVGGALFFDYGSLIGTDGDVPGEPSLRRNLPGSGYGYGLGVRVRSPLGPIRVDYAINEDGDSRIHFGIGERF